MPVPKVPNPSLHSCKIRINRDLPEKQRLILKCVSYILQRGIYSEAHQFVRIKSTDFPINNSGLLTRCGALSSALEQKLIYIDNTYLNGSFSKGYRVLPKGREAVMRNSVPVFSSNKIEAEETDFCPHPFFNDDLEIERMYPGLLRQLELSGLYDQPPECPLEAWRLFSAFRQMKSGGYRLVVDNQQRVYCPLTNMRKESRRFLSFTCGGPPLAEVDISYSNPVMMIKAGFVDRWEKREWGDLILSGRFYEELALPGASRKQSKQRINSIFNGGGFSSKGGREPSKTRKLLTERFPKTIGNLSKSVGCSLMLEESQIMNEIVCRLNRGLGIKAIRLHDAVLCDPKDVGVVVSLFEEAKLPTKHQSAALKTLS